MVGIADVQWFLTGGAANTDPNLSFGNVISSEPVESQIPTWASAGITGVTLDWAAGNDPADGVALLEWTGDAFGTMRLYGGDDGPGDAVDVSAGGTFLLVSQNGIKSLRVIVDAGLLPVSADSKTVSFAYVQNNIFDDVAPAEAQAGSTELRCLAVQNTTGVTIGSGSIRVWLESLASGSDDVYLAVESTKNTLSTITAEDDPDPVGLTFFSVTDYATGLVCPDIPNSGDYFGVWVKRVVPSSTTTPSPDDRFQIGLGMGI